MGLQNLLGRVLEKPIAVKIVWAIITLVGVAGLFRLNINPDLSSLQSDKHPEVLKYHEWRKLGAPYSPILVTSSFGEKGLEAFVKNACEKKDSIFKLCLHQLVGPGMSAYAWMTDELVPLAEGDLTLPFNMRLVSFLLEKEKSGELEKTQKLLLELKNSMPLTEKAGLVQSESPPYRFELNPEYWKGKSKTPVLSSSIAILFPIKDPVETAFNQKLMEELELIRQKTLRQFSKTKIDSPFINDFIFSGFGVMGHEESLFLKQRFLMANVLMLLGVAVVVALFFPSFGPSIRLVGCMAWLSVICTGIAGWLVADINAISMAFVATVLGLGVNEGVYLMVLTQGLSASERLKKVKEVSPALFVTGLTTIAGFGSLMLSGVKAFQDLGLLSVVGLTLCLSFMLSLWPHLMGNNPAVWKDGMVHRRSTLALNAAKYGGVLCLACCAILLVKGVPRFDLSYLSLLPQLPSVENYLKESKAEISSDIYLVKTDSLENSAKVSKKLEKVNEIKGVLALRRYEQSNGIKAFEKVNCEDFKQSLTGRIDDLLMQAEFGGEASALNGINELTRLVNTSDCGVTKTGNHLFGPLIPSPNPSPLKQFLNPREKTYFIFLRPQLPLLVDKNFLSFEKTLEDLGVDAWGPARLFYGFTRSVKEGFPRTLALAFGLTLFLLFVFQKKPGLVAMSIAPLIACLGTVLGLMAGLDWLGPVSCAAFPILIATCVDGPVLVRQTLVQEGQKGLPLAAQGLCLTQGTTIAAFLGLGLMGHPGISRLGLMISAGVLAALFFSLWWTPWFHSKLDKTTLQNPTS